MSPDLSIIIVNWNGGELLRRCIESVARYPASTSWEIILVDNASTDNSLEWVRAANLTNLRLIENRQNLGFGKANNLGFSLSSAPLLFLLNNDAEVQEGAIDRLIVTIRSGARVGACGPRIINPDGSLQVSVWRNPPTPSAMILGALRLYRLLPRRVAGELLLGQHWDHARRRRVNMLLGAAMLVKREVVDELGGFDERFHMYAEDFEWCLRIVRGGWEIVFEPEAVVLHHGGQATGKRWQEPERLLANHESSFLFYRISLSWWHNVANLAIPCLIAVPQLAWRALRRRPAENQKLALKLHFAELKRVLRGHRPTEPQ
ncbi:MAG: glycosyltransferase family 2 protein [Pyrinomonadaceae bacterium]